MTKDDKDVKVLTILHLVFSGFMLFSFLVTTLQRRMIDTFPVGDAFSPLNGKAESSQAPAVFSTFSSIIWFMGIFFICMFVANIASAYFMRSRLYRTFSVAIAGLNCFFVPVGTALGIYSLMVLHRDPVISSYSMGNTTPVPVSDSSSGPPHNG